MSDSLLTTEQVLELAAQRHVEVTERTLRYYALQGLLDPPSRGDSGAVDRRVRYYRQDVLDRLATIRRLQDEGYSLRQIRTFLGVQSLARPRRRGGRVAPETAVESEPRLASTGELSSIQQAPSGEPDAAAEAGAFPRSCSTAPGASEQVPVGLAPGAMLEALAGPGMAEIRRDFVQASLDDRSEAGLRRAALQYFEAQLALWVGLERAPEVLAAALAELDPERLETLIDTLRGVRNQAWLERVRRQGVPWVGEVRALVARVVCTEALELTERRALEALLVALRAQQGKLDELSASPGSLFARVIAWTRDTGTATAERLDELTQALHTRDLPALGCALHALEAQAHRLRRLTDLVEAFLELASPPR